MENVYATLEKTQYELDSKREMLELAALSFLAFAIPFLFPGPQLLTGVVVNSFLAKNFCFFSVVSEDLTLVNRDFQIV